jgi:hypothetical protein
MAEAMARDADSVDDAMLQLARMTAIVESSAAAFDALMLEQALQEMGQQLEGLEGFEGIAELLQSSEHERAAAALAQLGENIASHNQSLPAAGSLTQQRLGQMANWAGTKGLGELSESLSTASEGIQKGSCKQCKSGLCKTGNCVGKYGKRIKVSRAMRSQLAKLSECKSCLGKKYCQGCCSGGQCKGGQCKGKGIAIGPASLVFKESNSPSQKAGTAAAMNLFGRQTDLDGNRQQTQISGQLGAGPSETETEVSETGSQQAARHYREVYGKYRKMSDAVMIEEAVPLGHRQIIRNYFERIHPDRVAPDEQLRDVLDNMDRMESDREESPTQ